jgi:hypothetical protein
MKKIYLAAAIAIAIPTTAMADWSILSGQTFETVEPDSKYQLDTAGWNTRVYEWTPKSNPNVFCIAQFSEKGPVGMYCFEKG